MNPFFLGPANPRRVKHLDDLTAQADPKHKISTVFAVLDRRATEGWVQSRLFDAGFGMWMGGSVVCRRLLRLKYILTTQNENDGCDD